MHGLPDPDIMMMHPATPSSPQNFSDTVEKPCGVRHADTSALHERVHAHPADDGSYEDAESSPVPANSRANTHVPRAVLESMTHLPRDQAAATLGLCNTTFKKVCRRSGMLKWPYRRRSVGGSDTTDNNTNKHNDSPSPAPSKTSTSSASVFSLPAFAPTASGAFFAYPVPQLMSQGEYTGGDCSSLAAISPLAQSSCWGATKDTNFLPAILDYLDAFDAPSPPQIPSGSTSRGLAGPGEASASGVMGLSEGDVYAIVGIEPDSLMHAVGGKGWLL